MGLSDIEFTRTEMREMEEAAKESFRRKPHEKAGRLPKAEFTLLFSDRADAAALDHGCSGPRSRNARDGATGVRPVRT